MGASELRSSDPALHHRPTTVLCGSCQTVFGGRLVVEIDATRQRGLLERIVDDGLGALNPLSCPSCGWQHAAAAPVLVRGLMDGPLLVVPGAACHDLHRARAEAQARLLPASGVVADPGLRCVSDAEPKLATVLLGEPTLAVDVVDSAPPAFDPPPAFDSAPPPVLGPSPALDSAPPPVLDAAPQPATAAPSGPISVASMDRAVEDAFDAIGAEVTDAFPATHRGHSGATRTRPEPTADAGADELLADLLSARPSAAQPPVSSKAPEAAEPTDAWEALGEGWSLDAAVPKADSDPTHVVSLDAIAHGHKNGPPFEAPAGVERQLTLRDGRVVAEARITDADAIAYDVNTELRFQLHAPSAGPICGLLLVARSAEGEPGPHVLWPIDDQSEDGGRLLDALEASFAVDVRLYVDPTGPAYRQHHARPLELNVAAARAVLSAQQSDRAAAIDAVLAADYERVGRLRHNFQADSFTVLNSASEARLAVGILGYWSSPERRDYLLRIKSFPAGWFEAITRRVLEGAVHYGLAMEPPMRQRSFELKLAANSASLLRRLLANFAEVNLNLRPSGLDAFDIWDNWEALLAHAEELDLQVEEEIEELAVRAMERARAAAQQAEPIEINLAEESLEFEEVIELDGVNDEGLVACLAQPEQRLDAALVLLQRPGAVHVPALFDAFTSMPREELLDAVPAALSKGPAFENHFIGGLQARRMSLRLASALFLSEIRSERALTPLLALLPGAGEMEWPVLSRAAARMGRRIIGPALDLVEAEGDAGERIAHTLALLGGDARGALAAARDQRTDGRARICLSTAMAQINAVSFGDAADFGERLADAFAAVGPDQVGPDYSEVLDSIDLGPGASINAVSSQLDLDD